MSPVSIFQTSQHLSRHGCYLQINIDFVIADLEVVSFFLQRSYLQKRKREMTAQMCTRLHLAFFSPILPSYIAKKPSVINNCIINGAENCEMLIILKSIENADKSIHAPKASFNMYFILLHLFFLRNCIHIHLREPHGAICRYSSQCANFDDIEISLSPRNDELTQKLN